jgi:hypothetical protein
MPEIKQAAAIFSCFPQSAGTAEPEHARRGFFSWRINLSQAI